MELKGGHIELFVQNIEESFHFYHSILGCTLIADQGSVRWLAFGGHELLLRPGKPPTGSSYSSAPFGLVFYTDNLEDAKNTLEQKGIVFKGTDGSDKCLTFNDPDGHWLQLVNPEDH